MAGIAARLLNRLRGTDLNRQKEDVLKSGLFDKEFYLCMYQDVTALKMDPVEHFLLHGAAEGRYPSSDFSPSFYLEKNPDVEKSGMHPLIHYIRYGKTEQRKCISKEEQEKLTGILKVLQSGLWDADYYLSENIDVRQSGVNPLNHFLEAGGYEGRNPSGYFNTRFYLDKNPEVLKSGINPLIHYLFVGREKGKFRLPSQEGKSKMDTPAQKQLVFQYHIDELLRLTYEDKYLGYVIISGWCHINDAEVVPNISVSINDIKMDIIIPDIRRDDVVKLFGKTSYRNGFSVMLPIEDETSDLCVVEGNTNTVLLSGRLKELGKLKDYELSGHAYSGYLAYSKIPEWLIRQVKEQSVSGSLNPVHNYYESVFIPVLNTLARPEQQEQGYNVFGFFSKITGISEVARAFTNSLIEKNEPFVMLDYYEPSHKRISEKEERYYYDYYYKPFIYDKNILMVDWRMLHNIIEKSPKILKNKKNIVAFWWEFETGFEEKIYILNEFDEVYVFSDFIKEILNRLENRDFKVTKIKYPFYKNWKIIESPGQVRKKYGIENKFCFFFNFNYASGFRRKNPVATLQALHEEFPHQKDVVYFVKANRIMGVEDAYNEFIEKIKELGLEDRVVIHDEPLSRDGFMTLLNAMDCYISLHRGEGLGLGILEAYALKKPVIATNYGGNTEYMDNPLGYPVDYKLIPADDDFEVYRDVKKWAEPDISAARSFMREVYEKSSIKNNGDL